MTPYWMIERAGQSGPRWWVRGGRLLGGSYKEEWTADAAEAQHFAAKEYAQRHADELKSWGVKGQLLVTEHVDVLIFADRYRLREVDCS